MADIHFYDVKNDTWTLCEQELEVACSVAVATSVGGVLAVVGGELEPSARGHAGAGSFSDKAVTLTGDGAQVQTLFLTSKIYKFENKICFRSNWRERGQVPTLAEDGQLVGCGKETRWFW